MGYKPRPVPVVMDQDRWDVEQDTQRLAYLDARFLYLRQVVSAVIVALLLVCVQVAGILANASVGWSVTLAALPFLWIAYLRRRVARAKVEVEPRDLTSACIHANIEDVYVESTGELVARICLSDTCGAQLPPTGHLPVTRPFYGVP